MGNPERAFKPTLAQKETLEDVSHLMGEPINPEEVGKNLDDVTNLMEGPLSQEHLAEEKAKKVGEKKADEWLKEAA